MRGEFFKVDTFRKRGCAFLRALLHFLKVSIQFTCKQMNYYAHSMQRRNQYKAMETILPWTPRDRRFTCMFSLDGVQRLSVHQNAQI